MKLRIQRYKQGVSRATFPTDSLYLTLRIASMAPTAIYDTPPTQTQTAYPEHDSILPLPPTYYGPLKADPTVFPDGLKTSGQHCPIASLIRPYEEYPKKIEGPTVWGKADFQEKPDKWQRTFSAEEVEEIGQAADDFIGSGVPLTGITKVCPLIHLCHPRGPND